MAYKWTDGWLCRDDARGAAVRFFPEHPPVLGWRGEGAYEGLYWQWPVPQCHFWMAREWRKAYDLKPPARGKRFYISIQL